MENKNNLEILKNDLKKDLLFYNMENKNDLKIDLLFYNMENKNDLKKDFLFIIWKIKII